MAKLLNGLQFVAPVTDKRSVAPHEVRKFRVVRVNLNGLWYTASCTPVELDPSWAQRTEEIEMTISMFSEAVDDVEVEDDEDDEDGEGE